MILDGVRRVLFVHAHPDDETLATGALIAELVATGVVVCVLTATRGERGELMPGVPAPAPDDERFASHREQELADALVVLGVHTAAFLGAPPARVAGAIPRIYTDSGMTWVSDGVAGPAPDAAETSLTRASLEEVVADIVAYAGEVEPDALVSYDATGGYGHPDHVRCHDATVAAAARLGLPMIEVVPPILTGEPGVEWHDLSARLGTVQEALRRHRTQVRVDGADVVHVGGQREPIATRIGLRRRPVHP